MYRPKAFVVSDPEQLQSFIEQYSFATLVNTVDGRPFATHLPFLLDPNTSAQGALLGHMARANPQWRTFEDSQEVLVIFQGPHAYISPSWYETAPAVPTWNYAAVHVYGVPRIIEDGERLATLVDRLTAVYESGMPQPWPGDIPVDFKQKLLKAIVGFVIDITRIEGKFKLGQNRSLEDQQAVAQLLATQADPIAHELSKLTLAQLAKKASV